jgi:hypothetical protein
MSAGYFRLPPMLGARRRKVRVLVANRPRLVRGFVLATISDQPDIEVPGEINDYSDIEKSGGGVPADFVAGYAGLKTISLRRIVGAEPANEDHLSCFGAGAESFLLWRRSRIATHFVGLYRRFVVHRSRATEKEF